MKNYLLILIISFSIFVLFCSCINKKITQEKEYKDTLVEIKEIQNVYSNGYVEVFYGPTVGDRFYMKISSEKLSDLQNNISNYFIKHKIIPENEIADNEDYKETLLNKSTKEEYPIKNKYSISDNEFNSIIDLVIKDESRKSECFAKVKNKRNILDIEFFDLNSDGQDEYIINCSNSNCFSYNHCTDLFIIKKQDNKFITLFEDCCEDLRILDQKYNNYYKIKDSGLTGVNPIELTIYYRFDGNKFVQYKKDRKRIIIDEFDDDKYGD